MAAPKIAELRKMSDADLIAAHDAITDNTQIGIQYYLDELARRDEERNITAMLSYTRWLTWMTAVVTIATIINLWVAWHY